MSHHLGTWGQKEPLQANPARLGEDPGSERRTSSSNIFLSSLSSSLLSMRTNTSLTLAPRVVFAQVERIIRLKSKLDGRDLTKTNSSVSKEHFRARVDFEEGKDEMTEKLSRKKKKVSRISKSVCRGKGVKILKRSLPILNCSRAAEE